MACAWRFGDRMRTPEKEKNPSARQFMHIRMQTTDHPGDVSGWDWVVFRAVQDQARMDPPAAAAEDHTPSTPELKRSYLSLLSQNAIVDLVLSLDPSVTGSLFPADLVGEVRRMQSNSAADDVDGEGSPDPQPAPPPPRAPSVPPAGGPRTRAGAARAYAAALASKDTSSARPSPAPGGVSFSHTPEPQPQPQQPQSSPPSFAPIPQQFSSLVVHLPGGSPPLPSPATPTNPVSAATNPVWPPHSPTADSSTSTGPGPVRNTPVKKTRTGVIGGYNPITSIGPSNEGLPSYEEMIVLALMENQDGEGIAPKDVFAWMSARWPLNANFRPSASQALQKAYKRGRLEKVGTKYKINPNWHGGATTNRTTRRPQSMAEVPGNYAWAPPPVPPVVTVPPDPRIRHTPAPNPSPNSSITQQAPAEFDAQAQVASLLKALQEAGPVQPNSNPTPAGTGTEQNQIPNGEGGAPTHPPHLTMPGAPGPASAPVLPEVPAPAPPAATGSPTAPGPIQSPVQMPQLSIPMPPLAAPIQLQPGMPTPPVQTTMSPSMQIQNGIPSQNPMSPHIQNGMLQTQNGVPPQPLTNNSLPQTQPQHQSQPPPPNSTVPQPPHPMPPGVPMPYPPFHAAPTALQASLATLASQLANMSKNNQGV